MQLTLYHGTDLNNAIKIINKDFEFNANPKHWLGNGIYFYLEDFLAEWWTKKPSKSYGCTIKKPSIVKVTINIPEDKILDLRRYKVMEKTLSDFREYMGTFVKDNSKETIDNDALTSAFFNYYKDKIHYEMIICDFRAEQQTYYELDDLLRVTNLQYSETQVCLLATGLQYIEKKEIINYGD